MSNELYIDGKLVTVTNARRFVQARRPNATAHRERDNSWRGRSDYSVVSDRTGGAPWCSAIGKTAGEAWLKAARQMVDWDKKVAAERQALDAAVEQLRAAANGGGIKWLPELEAAALRYAAERIKQSDKLYGDARRHAVETLLELAEAPHELP